MTLSELRRWLWDGGQATLEVHGLHPALYVLFLRRERQLLPIDQAAGQPARFRSRSAALTALAEAGASDVTFVHSSAYGEMIGVEGGQERTELRERLRVDHLR